MKDKHIVIGTIINYVTVLVQMISTVVVTPFLIKAFGDNDYGIYKIIVALVSYLTILNFGIGNSLIRFLSELKVQSEDKKERGKEILGISLSLNFLACFIAGLVGLLMFRVLPILFSKSLNYYELNIAHRIFIFLLIGAIFSILVDIYTSYLFVYEAFAYVKSIELLKYIIRMVLVFCCVTSNETPVLLSFIDMIVSVGFFLMIFLYAWIKKGFTFNGIFNIKRYSNIKKFFSYSALFFLNLIIEQLIWNTDSIIIGMRLNATLVSVFSSGAIISAAFNSMTQIISTMIFPKIVMKFSNGNSNGNTTEIMIKVSRFQAFIAFYILCGYWTVGKYFVTEIWLNDRYEASWTTSMIVMVGTLASSLTGSGHLILRAIDKQLYFLFAEFCIFLANVVATYFLVMPYGIKGAAFSTTIAYIAGMGVFILPYYVKTINLDLKKYLAGIIAIAGPMTFVGLLFSIIVKQIVINSIYSMIFWGGCYTVIYLIVSFIIMNKDEKRFIKRIINWS